jgi:hypothetical protein
VGEGTALSGNDRRGHAYLAADYFAGREKLCHYRDLLPEVDLASHGGVDQGDAVLAQYVDAFPYLGDEALQLIRLPVELLHNPSLLVNGRQRQK